MASSIVQSVKEPLRIAAKAGFLTKRVWIEYFARGNRRWQNRQWKWFVDEGNFQNAQDYGFGDKVLTLTGKGKALAVTQGLDPVLAPHSKNLWHDEELIRLALFMERQGWISKWMTEPELKC